MKKLNLFRISLLFTVILVFVGCAKDGETGPQGPAGPAGPAGPTGTQGPKGDVGTANVIYSAWLDVTFQEDAANPGNFLGQITAPKLTSDIITKGEMKVYLNLGTAADPTVLALPISSDLGFAVIPFFEIGAITLLSDIDAGTEGTGTAKSFQYRYVLIPGVVPGRRATIDWNNYEEVKKHLGLTD